MHDEKTTKENKSTTTAVSEELFKTTIRQMLKSLVRAWGGDITKIHPFSTTEEAFIGADDIIVWEDYLRVSLPSQPPLQSAVTLGSPCALQYKAPKSDRSDLTYLLPTHQWIEMCAFEHIGVCSIYILAKAQSPRELESAKGDPLGLAYWVRPSDLDLRDFAFGEYMLRVDPEDGKWSKRPVESSLLPVSFNPDPEKLRARLEKVLSEIAPAVPRSGMVSSLEWIQGACEIVKLTARDQAGQGNFWRDGEITE